MKRDDVRHQIGETGGAAEGYGFVPFHRTEWSAAAITASSVSALAILMGAIGFASGFAGVPPAAVLSDVVPESSSGLGVGTYRFAGDLAAVFGPGLIGAAPLTLRPVDPPQ